MSTAKKILSALGGILSRLLVNQQPTSRAPQQQPTAKLRPKDRSRGQQPQPDRRPQSSDRARQGAGRVRQDGEVEAGRMPGAETVQVDPERIDDVAVGYSPSRNDVPDSGEVIWTWVPYEENDGRGKDRPVLVIGRHTADRVYAVRMTSKPHDGDRDFLSIGSGGWDSRGRESWVDIEQLYSVHDDGMRREAAVLDERRYARVAQAVISRYGWARKS